jgi:hypothetical protein
MAHFIVGARRFVIFTQPHIDDPHWCTACYEMVDDPEGKKPADVVEYTNFDVLEQLVIKVKAERARAAGYNQGALDILKLFGHTMEEYRTKVAERKAAKQPEAGIQ